MASTPSLTFWEKLDLFDYTYVLTFNYFPSFKTAYGGSITIVSFICIVISTVFLSQEMFLRNNPITTERLITTPHRPNKTFNISAAYIIEDTFGETIYDAFSYYTIQARYNTFQWVQDSNGDFQDIRNYKNLSMQNCTMDNFHPSVIEPFTVNNLALAYCIDDNQLVGGYYDDQYVNYISVTLTRCVNTTENNNICKSAKEIDDWISKTGQIQLSIYYEQVNYNPKNYSQPLEYFMGVKNYLIDSHFCKIEKLYFEEMTIITDSGFISESISNITAQKFIDEASRFYTKNPVTEQCLVDVRLYISENSDFLYRVYLKVPGLLAQLMTVFKLILSFFGAFVKPLYDRKMKEKVMERIFNVYNNDDLLKDADEGKPSIKVDYQKTNSNKNFKEIELVINNDNNTKNIDQSKDNLKQDSTSRMNIVLEGVDPDDSQKLKLLLEKRNLHKSEGEFHITFSEHFSSLFIPCHCNASLKHREKLYDSMLSYAIEYTDILSFASLKVELERLKFLLFNDEQLSMFNFIKTPELPKKKGSKRNLTMRYNFERDLVSQEYVLRRLCDKMSQPGFKFEPMSFKLFDLIE